MNNDINYHKIGASYVPPTSIVIKPVESQPVAAAERSEVLLPTFAQIDAIQKLNANANVNSDVSYNYNAA